MLRPKEFAPLPPVILGSVPSILLHQGRGNPSPRAGEGDALASGEWHFKNVQKALSKRPQYHPELSYLSPHSTSCGRRVSMTLLPTATLLCLLATRENPRPLHPSFSDLFRESCVNQHLCNNKANLLTRFETRCQKILGTDCASRPKMTGAGDVDLFPSVSFVLKVLLLKVSFFLPNPAKTC